MGWEQILLVVVPSVVALLVGLLGWIIPKLNKGMKEVQEALEASANVWAIATKALADGIITPEEVQWVIDACKVAGKEWKEAWETVRELIKQRT